MGPQGKVVGTVAKHGAGFAAEKIVEQQYKSRQAAQLAQQKAELEAGKGT